MSGVTRDPGFGVSDQICLTQTQIYKQGLEIWNLDIDIHLYPSSELLFSVHHVCLEPNRFLHLNL